MFSDNIDKTLLTFLTKIYRFNRMLIDIVNSTLDGIASVDLMDSEFSRVLNIIPTIPRFKK